MDWAKVAQSLEDECQALNERASSAFSADFEAQREMRTRAQIARMLAEALRAGMAEPRRR